MTDEARGMRTRYCGTLRSDDVGEEVALCGWVARRREHGEHLAFVDLRDHTGIVQCVVDGAARDQTGVRAAHRRCGARASGRNC